MQTVSTPAKDLEVARFTPETLARALKSEGRFIAGWKNRPNIDTTSHILIEVNFGDGFKVVGDGWVINSPNKSDRRFGKAFPFTVELDSIRLISNPEDFIKSPLTWPAKRIGTERDTVTYVNAAIAVVELDKLWVQNKTSDLYAVDNWNL